MSSTPYQTLLYHVSDADKESSFAILYKFGCLGLEEINQDPCEIKAYFQETTSLPSLIDSLTQQFPQITKLRHYQLATNEMQFKPQPFDPIPLLDDIWIIPPESLQKTQLAPHQQPLIIYPGAAFGTGRHESTRLAAHFIKQFENTDSLLDVGSGSGILAILARLLDIPTVHAIEIDAEARLNATENYQLNHCGPIVQFENLSQIDQSYTTVVANIVSPTLIALQKLITRTLAPGGQLILAGIVAEEKEAVIQAYQPLKVIDQKPENEWVSLVFQA